MRRARLLVNALCTGLALVCLAAAAPAGFREEAAESPLSYLTTPLAAGECLTGPGLAADCACCWGDRDRDGDIDLNDFALGQVRCSPTELTAGNWIQTSEPQMTPIYADSAGTLRLFVGTRWLWSFAVGVLVAWCVLRWRAWRCWKGVSSLWVLCAICGWSVPTARAATGDISGVTVLATGWEAELTIDGFDPFVTSYAGYADPNSSSAPTGVVFTVTSPGFTTTGGATTVQRTVYGTRTLRQIDPNDANPWEFDAGSTLTVRLALSDAIYPDDTATVTIAAGWATAAAGTTNVLTDGAVTNNSTLAYPRMHAAWAWPDLELWDSATLAAGYDLEVVAVDFWAANAQLAQCVKFVLTDQTDPNHTVTATTATPVLSSRSYPYSDANVPVVTVYKYTVTAAALSGANFVDNCQVQVSVTAYPRIGDSNAVLATTAGDPNSTLFTHAYYRYDPDDDYAGGYALVDPVSGDNATGAVAASEAAATSAYHDIRAAANALQSYHNGLGRNDPGNGTVLLLEGNYAWVGDPNAQTALNAQTEWLTVRPKAGQDPNLCKIAAYTDASHRALKAKRLKLQDLVLDPNTAGDICVQGQAGEWLWLDRCTVVQSHAQPPYYIYTNNYATRSRWTDGFYLQHFGTTNSGWRLIRSVYADKGVVTSTSCSANTYAVLGCRLQGGSAVPPPATNSSPEEEGSIQAWVAWYQIPQSLYGSNMPGTRDKDVGPALVGCLYEKTTSTHPVIELGSNYQLYTLNNVLIDNCTFAGERENLGYSWQSGATLRVNWRITGSALRNFCTKHDAFSNDPNDVGGHWINYGVSFSNNRYEQQEFPGDFAGLNQNDGAVTANYTASKAYPDPNGLGNYEPATGSDLLGAVPAAQRVMPYDLWGTPLSASGAAAGADQPEVSGLSFDLASYTWTYTEGGTDANTPTLTLTNAAPGSLGFTIAFDDPNYAALFTLTKVTAEPPCTAGAHQALTCTLGAAGSVEFTLALVAARDAVLPDGSYSTTLSVTPTDPNYAADSVTLALEIADDGRSATTLYVAPSGADWFNNCTDADYPCASVQTTYTSKALADDVLSLAAGTYGNLSLGRTIACSLVGNGPVTLAAAGDPNGACYVTSAATSGTVGFTGVTFEGPVVQDVTGADLSMTFDRCVFRKPAGGDQTGTYCLTVDGGGSDRVITVGRCIFRPTDPNTGAWYVANGTAVLTTQGGSGGGTWYDW